MKILLDASPAKLREYSERFEYEFWQLRTPLTQYKLAGTKWALDNGCFSSFDEKRWRRMVKEAELNRPLFVCMPDIVGDARRTVELFHLFKHVGEVPRALVLQDGIASVEIPWREIDAVFVGGSDAFKIAPECINACKAAKMLGKWVHVGRVNTAARVKNWIGLADSIDGSGLCKYDHMLIDVIRMLKGEHHKAMDLFEDAA